MEGREGINRIIFATENPGKLREVKAILADLGPEVLSLKEAGLTTDVAETGDSFEANAILKARAVTADDHTIVMADDSGLEVDALGGEPGIYSARYLGENTSYRVKNQTIINRLAGKTGAERSARFVCAIAALLPDGTLLTSRGTIEGQIGYEERGEGGFGYDPIFMVPELGRSTAELSPQEKNAISHRGRALTEMKEKLRGIL
ncbi:MAG: RdgB/HAM1 family non-canonical purine NTP pyrophosphatase [Lachnospiraceae bacterium]|nr:RdgB/HAM1 family non-canonical purine NTP pyrophosphatase [Lachnospiraceae bacterium]